MWGKWLKNKGQTRPMHRIANDKSGFMAGTLSAIIP